MSTPHDIDRTALAPRGEGPTSAYAWASSPLGDPTDSAGDLPYGHEFPPDPIAPAPKPKSINKAMVAAGLIGAIGASTALGIALFSGSPQPQHVAVASGSTGVPAAVPASVAPAPAPAAAPGPGGAPARRHTSGPGPRPGGRAARRHTSGPGPRGGRAPAG